MKKVILFFLVSINFISAAGVIKANGSINDFKKIYTKNIKGDMVLIGNTNMKKTGSGTTNQTINMKYYDMDGVSSTFNSSSATLTNKYFDVPIDNAKIIWAGLFWTGYLHNDQKDIGIDQRYKSIPERQASITFGVP